MSRNERNRRQHSNATAPSVRPSAAPETSSLEAPDPRPVEPPRDHAGRPLSMGDTRAPAFGGPASSPTVDARFDESEPVASPLSVGGKPTPAARELASKLFWDLRTMLDGLPHIDNTGARCRVDLDGHDACTTCNGIEAALRAWKEHGRG